MGRGQMVVGKPIDGGGLSDPVGGGEVELAMGGGWSEPPAETGGGATAPGPDGGGRLHDPSSKSALGS